MAEPGALAVFLVAAAAAALLWGRALWFCDERSPLLRRWVFSFMGRTRRRAGEVRSWLLSAVYCGLGLLLVVVFAAAWGLSPASLFALSPAHLAPVVLGVVGEISLANLLVSLGQGPAGGGERFAEVAEIPWMKGLRELPPAAVPVAAAVAGAVEELFFRGVVMGVLARELGVAPWVAIAVAGVLFTGEQLVQVRTRFQALVMGSGCAAISLVGGLLVAHTGSAVPAVLCHMSFVVFFLPRSGAAGVAVGR